MDKSRTKEELQAQVQLLTRLIAEQFPEWKGLAIRPVEFDGHDNRTFRLGEELSIRVPSSREHAAHGQTEFHWLPKLAPHLPLPIPSPLVRGRPGEGLAWQWSVYRWLRGESAAVGAIAEPERFAKDLAGFLNALQKVEALGAPEPGPDNFFRGGDLAVYDEETRQCLRVLGDEVPTGAAAALWESALQSTWQRAPVWIHGDVAPSNLLVSGGELSAVIDFGQLAAGDPACDLTIAWTMLSGSSREAFSRELAVDEGTWVRARGWALWKALFLMREARRAGSAQDQTSLRVIHDVLAEARG